MVECGVPAIKQISANKGKYSLVKLLVTIIDTAGIRRPTRGLVSCKAPLNLVETEDLLMY